MQALSLVVLLLLLTGCGAEDPKSTGAKKEDSLSVNSGTQTNIQKKEDIKKLLIGEMHWPDVSSYCTFFKEGHKFNFDDKKTWKFLFVTLFDEPKEKAYSKINDSRVSMTLINSSKDGNNEKRIYQVSSDDNIEIEVNISKVSSGYEHTEYSGFIRTVKPVVGESIKFYGDCGV